jgi:3-phosphoshikimate 1-carboxyvinyltransferase
MNLTVYPSSGLQGSLEVPGDKSLSHRAALFAALAEGESRVGNFLVSGVTDAMLRALTALDIPWELAGTALTVGGRGLHGFTAPAAALDCGNSATTIRLLAGALAASGVPAVLDGSQGLRRRPMERIAAPLRQMGVPIQTAEGGCAPLRLGARPAGQPLAALRCRLTVASAQVKTCLLLAALSAASPSQITEPALSRDHTERMLRGMGVEVETRLGPDGSAAVLLTPPARPLSPLRGDLPGDFSAASFLIVAALIAPGSCLELRGVGLNPTRTGLLTTLLEMGADIQIGNRRETFGEPLGDLTVTSSHLRGTQVAGERVVQMIDEFPAFAAAAACAEGPSMVSGAEELRFKESDRISALCSELRAVGVAAQETPDGFILPGAGAPAGGGVDPHGDHRLAMALAVAGLASRAPLTVRDAQITAESFPDFAGVLRSLGARLETA